jgi:hypothetical protein
MFSVIVADMLRSPSAAAGELDASKRPRIEYQMQALSVSIRNPDFSSLLINNA